MQEGYLHDKIRKQEDQINSLKEQFEKLGESYNKLKLFEDDILKTITKLLDNWKRSIFQQFIFDVCDEYTHNKWQDTYLTLHSDIKRELNLGISSNKELIKQFCDEVVLQRKDLGNIMSVLISKGYITQEEFNKLDKAMIKEMEKRRVREHVLAMFMPILKKGKKINQICE